MMRGGAARLARLTHTQKVASSNLAPAILIAALVAGCSTSYKIAPSTQRSSEHAANVSEHVSKAQVITKSNRDRTVEIFTALNTSHVTATSVVTDLDAAIKSLQLKNYPKVAEALVRAKIGEGMLLDQFKAMEASTKNIIAGNDSLLTELNAAYAETDATKAELRKLQDEIDPLARSQAKNQAIVDQVNWGFGLGAFIYGIKRILTFGFFGVLGLGAVAIVMLLIGGPAGALALRALQSFLGFIRKRK